MIDNEEKSNDLPFTVIPYRLITKIINRYYVIRPSSFVENNKEKKKGRTKQSMIYIWREISLLEFFGRFKFDVTRKIFPIFTSLSPECEIYGAVSRKIPFPNLCYFGETLIPRFRYPPVPASLSRRLTRDELFGMMSDSRNLKSLDKRCMADVPPGITQLKNLKRLKLLLLNSVGRVGEERYRNAVNLLNKVQNLKSLYISVYPANHDYTMNDMIMDEPMLSQVGKIPKEKRKKRVPKRLEFLPKLTTLCLLGGYFVPNFLHGENVVNNLKRLILTDIILDQDIVNKLHTFQKLMWLELEQFHIPVNNSSSGTDTRPRLFDLTPIFSIPNLNYLFISTLETEPLVRLWNNLRLTDTTSRNLKVLWLKIPKHPLSELIDQLLPTITSRIRFLCISSGRSDERGHLTLRRDGCELQFKKDRILKKIVVMPEKNTKIYKFSAKGHHFPRTLFEKMVAEDVHFDFIELMDHRLSDRDIAILSRNVGSLSLFECHLPETFVQEFSSFAKVAGNIELDRCIFPEGMGTVNDFRDRVVLAPSDSEELKTLRISNNLYSLQLGYFALSVIPHLSNHVDLSFEYTNLSIMKENAFNIQEEDGEKEEEETSEDPMVLKLSNFSENLPAEERIFIMNFLVLVSCNIFPIKSPKHFCFSGLRVVDFSRCNITSTIFDFIKEMRQLEVLKLVDCEIECEMDVSNMVNLRVVSLLGNKFKVEEIKDLLKGLEKLRKLKIVKLVFAFRVYNDVVSKIGRALLKEKIGISEFHLISPEKKMVEMFKSQDVLVVVQKGFKEQKFKFGAKV